MVLVSSALTWIICFRPGLTGGRLQDRLILIFPYCSGGSGYRLRQLAKAVDFYLVVPRDQQHNDRSVFCSEEA
jgi:hypothetical protein